MDTATPKTKIEITDYTDYIKYLSDLFKNKQDTTQFSFRVFCRKSGFKSPSYLKWVLDGTRPISLKSIHKFIMGLSLDRREAQYFTLMVNYREAPDPQTKRFYYEQMLTWQKRRSGPMAKDTYEYLSHWYYIAIRELIASRDFKDDPAWIRDRIDSDLTVWEIKSGLDTLERLGLIKRDQNGKWQQTDRDLHTGPEVHSLAAFNYHLEMLDVAQKVLSKHTADNRDYQSLVSLLDRETYDILKKMTHQFQNEVAKIIKQQEAANNGRKIPQELYALNVQLLPLSMRRKGEL